MKLYNKEYSYEDISLWEDETWMNRENEAAPIFKFLEKVLIEREVKEYYVERSDEIKDTCNQQYYFKDVVEDWRHKGMFFSSYGMMGIVMAPAIIEKQQLEHPKVLFIPYIGADSRYEAMNLLAANKDLLEQASIENVLVQFIDVRMASGGAMTEKAIETAGTFRISYDEVYLDATLLDGYETKLKTSQLCGRKVVDISGMLVAKSAHQYDISRIYKRIVPEWNYDMHIRSTGGKRQAESMKLERDCRGVNDEKLQELFKEKGICYEEHQLDREWYVTLTPKNAYNMDKGTLPLLIVMKESRESLQYTMLTAFQFYYDFIEICGQGQFMMLFFAMETPKDNDELLPNVIENTIENYSMVDETRVYLVGQSHNGYYAQEFYRNHPKLIAACAALCDPVGLEYGARADYYLTDAKKLIIDFQKYDYPLIDINGNLENNYIKNRTKNEREDDIKCFQNRMKAWRHKIYSDKEIDEALTCDDYATRMNGVPSDRTEVRYIMGTEVYISDYVNDDGNCLFRYESIENTPHMIMPQMAELSWEFLRRFNRDTQTGEITQIY